MPHTTQKSILSLLSVLLFAAIGNCALAEVSAPDDHLALAGLSESKAIFDITSGNPKKLNFYLGLIAQTAESMQEQGVTPTFVLAFRGPATRLISSDRSATRGDQGALAENIASKLEELGNLPNVSLQQCGVAARVLKVDVDSIHPAVTVVGNSWISLIGYQNRGYAVVPVR